MRQEPTRLPESTRRAVSPAVLGGWLLALLTAGIVWRLVRYAVGMPFWGDEAYLNYSILRMDHARLLTEPLEYAQIAPLFFVWLQRSAFEWFGGGEYSLRLVPLLAGLGGLLIFARLAWVLLPTPLAAVLATGLYAVSYRIVRHAAESKPYATDGLAAVALLYTGWRWLQQPASTSRALTALAVALPAVWLSYPAVFVAGGVGLAVVLRSLLDHSIQGNFRRREVSEATKPGRIAPRSGGRPLLLALLFCVGLAAGFLGHYRLFAAAQAQRAAGSWLEEYWSGSYPPTDGLVRLGGWLLEIHTGRMFGYPIGGAPYGSTLTALSFVIGAGWLARRRGWGLLMLIGPFVLTLMAAALHKYPYGGAARLSMHLAPAICLLAGAGLALSLDSLRPPLLRARTAGGVGVFLLMLPVLGIALDLWAPRRSWEQDELVRSATAGVVAAMAEGDPWAIANRQSGAASAEDGPRFDPAARYYLESARTQPPLWLDQPPGPTQPTWVLVFHGQEVELPGRRLAELLAAWKLEAVQTQTFAMSERRNTRLELLRVRPIE